MKSWDRELDPHEASHWPLKSAGCCWPWVCPEQEGPWDTGQSTRSLSTDFFDREYSVATGCSRTRHFLVLRETLNWRKPTLLVTWGTDFNSISFSCPWRGYSIFLSCSFNILSVFDNWHYVRLGEGHRDTPALRSLDQPISFLCLFSRSSSLLAFKALKSPQAYKTTTTTHIQKEKRRKKRKRKQSPRWTHVNVSIYLQSSPLSLHGSIS